LRYSRLAARLKDCESGKVWPLVCRQIARKETLKILTSHYHAVRFMAERKKIPLIPWPARHFENVDLVPIPNSLGVPELGGMISEYNERLASAGRLVIPSRIATLSA
jgi:hypothetical protein